MQSQNWQGVKFSSRGRQVKRQGGKDPQGWPDSPDATHSTRMHSILGEKKRYSQLPFPSFVRNLYSAEANSDVFTLEIWATLYKQQISITSSGTHYTNVNHYTFFWHDVISSALISQENLKNICVICQTNQ